MNYDKQEKSGIEIDLFVFLRLVLKKLWLIVILAIVFGVIGTGLAMFTQDDVYTSKMSFVVNTLQETDKAENSDISASISVATTYQYILTSRSIIEKTVEGCELPVTYEEVENSMTVNSISGSSVIEIYIKTDRADKSYAIAKSLVDNYDEIVSEIYSNAHLNICDLPVKADKPDSSSLTILIAAIGAILGAILGVVAVLIYYITHDTVRSAEDIINKVDINILASVNVIGRNKTGKPKALLVSNKKLGFAFIETFKAIRTKVETNAMREGNKVFMVTSACENEGKTTISTNLAITLAQNGKSVLLIDADLRKPSVALTLDLAPQSGKGGLAGVITGKIPLEASIRYIENHRIFVIADTRATDNPSELLSTKKMADIIKAVKSEFDYVIIDTAPASVVTDASVISALSDASILVISEDKAPISRIKMAINDIDASGATVIGCVYNKTSSSGKRTYGGKYGSGYYGSYGYGSYGYGYGYGYGNSSEKK